MRLVKPNHRQIARWIIPNHRSRHSTSVRQRYPDPRGLVYDVAVSQDQPIGRKHESRSPTTPFARLARACASRALVHFNIHHRRTHALDRTSHSRRISVEEGGIRTATVRVARRASRFRRPSPCFAEWVYGIRMTKYDGKFTSISFQVHAG